MQDDLFFEESDDQETSESAPPPKEVTIHAEISPSFTYASFQNAIPVLRSLRIENTTENSLEKCILQLAASPPFLRAKVWTLDRLRPGDSLPLSDRRVDLDPTYLSGLNEAERGTVSLTLLCGEKSLAEIGLPVRLLARDEWGGVNDMAQLLPAFVMPNDPAIPSILRAAAESLENHGHSSAIDGYQTEDPRRSYMLLAAIYSAIAGFRLHYAEPPASFECRGQKIRRPGTILNERLATCLDTSVLFAGVLEAAGLNSVVLMFQGHSTAGVWLTKRTLPKTVETDPIEIRKAIAARELVVFETTGVTHRPPMTLDQALSEGRRWLDETQAANFVAAIDVRRSRSSGITPLASHKPDRIAEDSSEEFVVNLQLPQQPDFGSMPVEEVEQKPTTADGRIDRWQRKLLDLSLRNRLLNFVESKKTVPFLCPDVAYLEDRLADRASIRLISLSEHNPLGDRDEAVFREARGRDLNRTFAVECLQRDELPSPLESRDLESRLITLYRQVKSDLAEGGTNTLFMAVGFLRWKRKPEEEKTYRAPLLLVPVKLER